MTAQHLPRDLVRPSSELKIQFGSLFDNLLVFESFKQQILRHSHFEMIRQQITNYFCFLFQ